MFALTLRVFILMLLIPCATCAELNFGTYITSHTIIEEQQAYQQVKDQLNSKKLSYYGIIEKVDALKKHQEFAFRCSVQKEKIIAHIDNLKRHNKLADSSMMEEQSFYDLKRAHSVSELSSCQKLFFDIQTTLEQTNDFIVYAKNYRHKNNQRPNIIEILAFKNIWHQPLMLRSWNDLYQFHFNETEIKIFCVWFATSLVIGLFLAVVFKNLASLTPNLKVKFVFQRMASYIPLFLPLVAVYKYIYNVYIDMLDRPSILTLLFIVIIYMVIRLVSECYFQLTSTIHNQKWLQEIKSKSGFLVNLFFILGIIRFFVLNAFQPSQTEQVIVLGYFLSINILLSIMVLRLLISLTNPQYFRPNKMQRLLMIRKVGIVAVILASASKITMLLSGYYQFSINYFIFIVALIFIYFKFVSLLKEFESYLQSGNNPLSRKLYYLLGMAKKHNIIEITLLRYALVIYSGLKFFTFIIWALGVPQYYFIKFKEFFYQAQTIGQMKFVIIDFVYAGLCFCLLMILGKITARHVSECSYFGRQNNLRTSIALLIRYVFFSVTLVFCFLILGFNFTQITVLLGGVGLGLGVGLQSLVLDFIAGIIIIIQKTIHIGDFVSINASGNNSSGYVQKIQLLSTQIISNEQSLLYIPNSSLIKGVVNNHSAYQSIEKCVIPFDFKNSVDFEAGKIIILNLVARETNIINSGQEKPMLMIDTAYRQTKQPVPDYILHLVFNVKDISSKQETCHHLQEAIYQAFADQGIKLDNEV